NTEYLLYLRFVHNRKGWSSGLGGIRRSRDRVYLYFCITDIKNAFREIIPGSNAFIAVVIGSVTLTGRRDDIQNRPRQINRIGGGTDLVGNNVQLVFFPA